ncbi:hypothetical protein PsYK624_101070 [Phanerochaete sordida]|uniref:Uncharacterized protein n=1 Tax=Phanerochaete sordida TaxID=48140 RepID=A0A9P3LHB1_9APHY|nr:hypothetical protein PsYK624_101070 [Phanerochaete sordida]
MPLSAPCGTIDNSRMRRRRFLGQYWRDARARSRVASACRDQARSSSESQRLAHRNRGRQRPSMCTALRRPTSPPPIFTVSLQLLAAVRRRRVGELVHHPHHGRTKIVQHARSAHALASAVYAPLAREAEIQIDHSTHQREGENSGFDAPNTPPL